MKISPYSSRLIDTLKDQTNKLESLLRDALYYKSKDPDQRPTKIIEELIQANKDLAYTIKDIKIQEENSDREYNIFEYLNKVYSRTPEKFYSPDYTEFELYQSLGFNNEEYDELNNQQKSMSENKEDVDFEKVFDEYIDEILEKKELEGDWKKLLAATGGLIGISTDIISFSGSLEVTILIRSVSLGLIAITTSFDAVKRKFKKWLRKK